MIQTKMLSEVGSKMVVFMAKVTPKADKPDRYFTGYSQAKWGDGRVNQTAALENAETSAVGRALGFMGIGVIESVASADEMRKAGVGQELDHMEKQLVDHGCQKCGAELVKNPKTGKLFCKEKCWLKV